MPRLAEFRGRIRALRSSSWIGPARSWWPLYLFHCSDITNVVKILRSGELLSRAELQRRRLTFNDIASRDVIANTDLSKLEFARLYFRPRTPTQFRNEGMRPPSERSLNAHCAVPVYLLFDSVGVLGTPTTQFTNGNFGSPHSTVLSRPDQFADLPFELIYHEGPMGTDERENLVFHRNAEVLVPTSLGLEHLDSIVCRSQAEYETLLHLLGSNGRRQWAKRIGLQGQWHLFHRQWTFIEHVDMTADRIRVTFNPDTTTPGPFDAGLEITDTVSGRRRVWRDAAYLAASTKSFTFDRSDDYVVKITLSGDLAYQNRYVDDTLPF